MNAPKILHDAAHELAMEANFLAEAAAADSPREAARFRRIATSYARNAAALSPGGVAPFVQLSDHHFSERVVR